MMWTRVVIPLVIFLIIAAVVLILVLNQRRKSENLDREERLTAEKRWTGDCQFDNPETGAKCQRQDFHLENHFREVGGKFVTW